MKYTYHVCQFKRDFSTPDLQFVIKRQDNAPNSYVTDFTSYQFTLVLCIDYVREHTKSPFTLLQPSKWTDLL